MQQRQRQGHHRSAESDLDRGDATIQMTMTDKGRARLDGHNRIPVDARDNSLLFSSSGRRDDGRADAEQREPLVIHLARRIARRPPTMLGVVA
jgi:hypothetical protein